MSLSKLVILAGSASAGIGDGRFPMLRALVDHSICESNFGGLEVPNGEVRCNGPVCVLDTCDKGYHKLKTEKTQSKKVRSRQKNGKNNSVPGQLTLNSIEEFRSKLIHIIRIG